jgi:hypothetical protein
MKIMKHNFFALIITGLFTITTALAYSKTEPPHIRISLDKHFSLLEVNDHISVVLTNETGKEISVEGATSKAGKIRASVKKGKLTLWLAGSDKGEKLKVYVPARLLKQVVINGDSKVSTATLLDNEELDVVVNGACQLALRSKGRINVSGTNEYEFRYSDE